MVQNCAIVSATDDIGAFEVAFLSTPSKSNPVLLWSAKHLLTVSVGSDTCIGEGEKDVLEERWLSDGV